MQYSPPAPRSPPSASAPPARTSVDELAMMSLFDSSLVPPGEILQDPARYWPHREESIDISSAMDAVSSWLSNLGSFNIPMSSSISPVVSSSSTSFVFPQGRVINKPLTLSWLCRLQTMTRRVPFSTVHRRRSNWRCPPPAPVECRRMMPPLDYRPRFLVPESGELFRRRRWPVVLRPALSVWHLPVVRQDDGSPCVRRQAAWDRDRAAVLPPRTLVHLRLNASDERRNERRLRTALLRCQLVVAQRRRVRLECEAWSRTVVTVALRHTFYWSGRGGACDVLVNELAGLGRVSSATVAGVELRFARTLVQVERRLCRPAVRSARVGPRRVLLADSGARVVPLSLSERDRGRVHVGAPLLCPHVLTPKQRMQRRQP